MPGRAQARAGPSGKHGVSQLCSAGCQVSPGCCRSAPLLTGKVKEIKWNIPSLILPNALWHPHSAETAGVPAQRESDKTNSANWERDPTPRDACTSLTLMSPDRRGLVHTTFNKLWRMFWVALPWRFHKRICAEKSTIKSHKIRLNSAFTV